MEQIKATVIILVIISSVAFAPLSVQAQETDATEDNLPDSMVIQLNKTSDRDANKNTKKDEENNLPYHVQTRRAAGIFAGYTSVGPMNALIKSTAANSFVNQSGESGFILGALVDIPISDFSESHGIRIYAGLKQITESPPPGFNTALPYDKNVSEFYLALQSRFYFLSYPSFMMWTGGGFSLEYVLGTGSSIPGATPVTNIKNSFGFDILLTLGFDLKIQESRDLIIEANYIPGTNFQLVAGLKFGI